MYMGAMQAADYLQLLQAKFYDDAKLSHSKSRVDNPQALQCVQQ